MFLGCEVLPLNNHSSSYLSEENMPDFFLASDFIYSLQNIGGASTGPFYI